MVFPSYNLSIVSALLLASMLIGCLAQQQQQHQQQQQSPPTILQDDVVSSSSSSSGVNVEAPPPLSSTKEEEDGGAIIPVPDSDDDNDDDDTNNSDHNGVIERQGNRRVELLGLEDVLNLHKSDAIGLGNDSPPPPPDLDDDDDENNPNPRLDYDRLHANDMIEDSFFDPFAPDPSCAEEEGDPADKDCWSPPDSTVEEEMVRVEVDDCDDDNGDGKSSAAGLETLAWGYGGADPDDVVLKEGEEEECDDDAAADPPSTSGEGKKENDVFVEEENDAKHPKTPQCKKAAKSAANSEQQRRRAPKTKYVDKHWGSDVAILKMRDRLRGRRGKYWDLMMEEEEEEEEEGASGGGDDEIESDASEGPGPEADKRKKKKTTTTSSSSSEQRPPRPPVFLLPGLASTRLVSWKHKPCPQSSLLSDIKMLDHVWLNMNFLVQMATIDARCWSECMTLGRHQSDYDDEEDKEEEDVKRDEDGREGSGDREGTGGDKEGTGGKRKAGKREEEEERHGRGCKLRPDEGLDSISSLAPGSKVSNLFVGGTNTVYAWLIQWLADNLGYDVTSIVALPYDWRLSPDKMEARDGFLTLTKKKIEAAVESNGRPGIMVAHSMGNSVFRYFLEWLRVQFRETAYERYVQQAERHEAGDAARPEGRGPFWRGWALHRDPARSGGGDDGGDDDSALEELARLLESDEDGDQEQTAKEEEEEEEETKSGYRERSRKYPKLYELAMAEGDAEWLDWQGKHIWTYVGLAAPMLGASGPLRSVLSGENMGLPFTDEEARGLELSFGSTSNVNPISTKMGFCDGDDAAGVGGTRAKGSKKSNSNLACLEEIVSEIESTKSKRNQTDPWKNFPALRLLLKDRVDFDSIFPMVQVERQFCEVNNSSQCNNQTTNFGAKDVMNGQIFYQFSQIWKEKGNPLGVKLDQLQQAWWHGNVPNYLETTPDRPHIKHVILAYGTDVPTEVGYVYKKTDLVDNSTTTDAAEFDGLPALTEIIVEEPQGKLLLQSLTTESTSFISEKILRKKKQKRRPLRVNDEAPAWLHHSGDGTIPYISLMWAHTWLLHATRAMRTTTSMLEGERISNPKNHTLDSIIVTHRPKGGNEWVEGYGADPRDEENVDLESRSNIGDTGTSHPHGTKYKPKMVRFQSSGKSRSTGMEYTTTVIEAIGVEHKETTRNYDILAAAFSDVLKNLHDDYLHDYGDL